MPERERKRNKQRIGSKVEKEKVYTGQPDLVAYVKQIQLAKSTQVTNGRSKQSRRDTCSDMRHKELSKRDTIYLNARQISDRH